MIRPNQFWLTGSQQFHLMKGVSESLAGRVAILQLMGFAQAELKTRSRLEYKPILPAAKSANALTPQLTLKQFYHRIWRGAFPKIALNNKIDWHWFYSSYIQ